MKKSFRLPVPFAVLAALASVLLASCATRSRPEVVSHAESAEVVSHAESAEAVSHAESAENAESVCRGVAVPLIGVLGMLRTGLVEDRPDALEMLLPHVAEAGKELATAEAYPDADEVSLFEWEGTRYETNGTYTTTWTSLSRILTQRGLENNRTFSFWNNDFYGSTTVLVARVFSPGGVARDIDLVANLAEAIDTGSLASNIHDPNDKTFTLALPGLQVGDSVALVMRRETRRPRCEGVYSDYLTFESDHPILFQGVRITGPASMPLRSRAFRDAGPVSLEHAAFTNEEAGTITEVWTAGETPRFFAEPHMPPAYDCTARLLLSTAPDWESLSRWYARLCAPHLAATNAAMARKVEELVSAATRSAAAETAEEPHAAAAEESHAEFAEFAEGAAQGLPPSERGVARSAGGSTPCAAVPAASSRTEYSPRLASLGPPLSEGGEEDGSTDAGAADRADARPPAPAKSQARAAVIRALFDFVSREVRYMGAMAESEAPGYEPHDVSLTFDNRYGVCRDKAALLVAMLRMAGIDAWPVLINVGPRKAPDVPQPYFNHAIVAADSGDPDDPYLLMDPTSETTRSLLPEYLCEMSYLVARDEGEGIRETPPLPVEQNLLRAETVYTLHADASADVTTTLSFAGVNDAAYRGYFASISRDAIRAFFERLLAGIPGAVLTGWEVRPAPEALRTSPEPLSVRLDYAIAEAARGAEDGRAALLDLPTVPAALAIASRVVGDLGLEKRRFPLVTDYPCGWEETVEIRLPDGVALSPAPAAERQSE